MNQKDLTAAKKLYKQARVAYYNAEPLMTDREFDALENRLRAAVPDWKELHRTGVKSDSKKTDVKLDCYMPSLNKLYPEDVPGFRVKPIARAVRLWILMDKLDGTSLQLAVVDSVPTRLMTRGDGETGKDISFFIPWLIEYKVIPARIRTEYAVLRLEALMPKAKFQKNWSRDAKGVNGFDNSRNMVNGLFNRRDKHPALKDVHLVVLGVYSEPVMKGLKLAERWGFKVVPWSSTTDHSDITDKVLSSYLRDRRKEGEYEIDGLALADGNWVYSYTENEKPKIPVAFKLNEIESAEVVEVLEVVWQKTRTGRWQPKIKIPPTVCDGATVTNCTAENPQWMQRKGIGPGAKVKVLRSGGVIPKIVEVVEKADFVGPPGAYKVKGAYFMIAKANDSMVKCQGILHFLNTLGVENIAIKTVIKLHDCGLFTSTLDYVRWPTASSSDPTVRIRKIQTKAGFGPKQAQNLDEELMKAFTRTIPLRDLMVASGFFPGVGDRKFRLLEDGGVRLLRLVANAGNFTLCHSAIEAVKGFGSSMADMIYAGLEPFGDWLAVAERYLVVDGDLPKKKKAVKGDLAGQFFSWTGYRNVAEEEAIIARGGEVIKLGAKTTVLFYNPAGKFMDKVHKAKCQTAVYPEWVLK